MARSSILRDLSGLPDPLLSWNFDLSIPNVPGGGNGQQILLRCQSASIPGHANEEGIIPLRGSEITYAGRPLWEHNFDVQILECRDMATRDSLMGWLFMSRDNRSSGTAGSFMSEYKTLGDVILYDDKGSTIRTIRMHGFWLQSAQMFPLDSQGQAVSINGSFRYDWFEDL